MAGPGVNGWRGRRVLVTGHSGFIGSWLAVSLRHLGATVTGYATSADPDTRARAGWLADLGVRDIRADVGDLGRLTAAVHDGQYDTVVHLAAQPLVSVGFDDPYGTMSTNVGGSMAVLEAVRRCGTPVLLHVTSDKCYRNRSWPWPYREIDEIGAGCPYSTSKAAAEIVFGGYARLYAGAADGPRAVSIRFGNVVGGGDHAVNRLVPDCIRALAEGRSVELRQPAAVRPFQHVLDVVHGLLLAGSALHEGTLRAGDVLNFGPPDSGISTGRLADALAVAWGGPRPDLSTRDRPGRFHEEPQLRLDGRKAIDLLGWRHEFGVEEMASSIAGWHRRVSAGASPADCTADDATRFLQRVTRRAGSEQR